MVRLADQFGQYSGPTQAAYVPRLHVELLTEMARDHEPQDGPALVHALGSPAPDVRRAALLAWTDRARTDLPDAAIELRDDQNAGVRSALLAVLAVQQAPQAREILTRGLDDLNLEVRMAAIDGLAELGGEQSDATLRKLQQNPAEMVRAAAVGGLARLGAIDAILSAAKDKSWVVRQAVATSLSVPAEGQRPIPPESIELAHSLLADKSLEVQKRAVVAVATWPLPQAGPILLTAIADGGHQLRKDAARLLAERWEPAARFPYDSEADIRAQRVAELRAQWSTAFGPVAATVSPCPPRQRHPRTLLDRRPRCGLHSRRLAIRN